MSELSSDLAVIVGSENVSTTDAERDLHSSDESSHPAVRPDAVTFPATTAEVRALARYANENSIPLVGWGAGTSVEGHPIPTRGGIVVDFRRMNRILAVHPQDFQAEVQPGVLRLDLEEQLSTNHGLFFAPDPGANASIGGIIANNAAGVRALRYGAASANVLGLEVVLADGTIVATGSRSVKQSAGYDLTSLFVGSEGTLGLITAATIKLVPIPEYAASAIIAFPDVVSASHAVHSIMGHGLEPSALELLHRDHIAWMNDDDGAALPVATSLMIDFTGPTEALVEASLELAINLCSEAGADNVARSKDHQERKELWRLRHGVRERSRRRFAGHEWISMDVSVPISQLPTLVEFCEQVTASRDQEARILSHAGDGNIHLAMHFDPTDQPARSAAVQTGEDLVHKAIELGGTCSGEHGIGIGKKQYMVAEHGAAAVEAMRAIKQALDPNGILNPDKVLPSRT